MIVLDLTENDQQRVTVKHRLFKKVFFLESLYQGICLNLNRK